MGDASFKDAHFIELVMVFQQAAWQALGKIANPLSGKTETSLPQARHAIDMLAMLERKTEGHLTEAERRILSNALTQLRLNYVDAVGQRPPGEPSKESTPPEGEAPNQESGGPEVADNPTS